MKRRTLLSAAAGSIVAPAILSRAAWGANIKLDVKNPEHLYLIFRKLSYSMNSDVTFWMLHATRYGQVDHKLTPFWQMNVATWFSVKDMDDGAFEVTNMGATFYTDPKTGAFMETFKNPYNGKEFKLPYGTPKPVKLVYTREHPPSRPARAGYKVTDNEGYGPAWIEGNDIWIRSDTAVRGEPSEAGKKVYQINDLSTYFGAAKDVANTGNKNPAAKWAFNDVNTFPDYMEMESGAGAFFSRGLGRKIFRYQDMPALWRDLMEKRFPDVARDPAGALKG
jgi:hypothetical protein